MKNNGNQIFLMKKFALTFVSIFFSKSRDLPEPISEPGFKVGTGIGKFLTGSATQVRTFGQATMVLLIQVVVRLSQNQEEIATRYLATKKK